MYSEHLRHGQMDTLPALFYTKNIDEEKLGIEIRIYLRHSEFSVG